MTRCIQLPALSSDKLPRSSSAAAALRAQVLSCVRAVLGCIRAQRSGGGSGSSVIVIADVNLADGVMGFGSRYGLDVSLVR
jgi:hypothetical protein